MSSLEALFCAVDDFCLQFEPKWQSELLATGIKIRKRAQGLCLSEKMTLLIAFHHHHYRNFKHLYLDRVCLYWGEYFPGLPSYQRFIEHSRHRSPVNFGVNLICGLVAYCHQPKKPGLSLEWVLPPAP